MTETAEKTAADVVDPIVLALRQVSELSLQSDRALLDVIKAMVVKVELMEDRLAVLEARSRGATG